MSAAQRQCLAGLTRATARRRGGESSSSSCCRGVVTFASLPPLSSPAGGAAAAPASGERAPALRLKNGKVVRDGAPSLPPPPLFQNFLGEAGPSPALLASAKADVPYLSEAQLRSTSKKGRMYVETYGCQMNVNDMEIVLAIMGEAGYTEVVERPEEADVIFINTCAIRDNAESKVWQRLSVFRHMRRHWNRNAVRPRPPPPKVAVLGCMAERLKARLLEAEKMADVVCGPDAYRDLPRLLAAVDEGQAAINTLLSLEETYADVSPVRLSTNSVSAYVSIMRGCNNMCSFCIVPFTRGRERSRPAGSIVREVGELWRQGVKEVILLGQNVNSYNDTSGDTMAGGAGAGWLQEERALEASRRTAQNLMSPGFTTVAKVREVGLTFTHLLDRLSSTFPGMRFRFTSPHPKHFPEELLYLMKDRHNICNSIHLPAQSGSSQVLERMRRGYSREAYLALVKQIRSILPDASISSDFITGFCGETEEDHADTLSLVEAVGYDMAYMFAYSMREKTHASHHYEDDVPEPVKQRRLAEVIDTFRRTTGPNYELQLGSTQLVLIDGPSKRNPAELSGRNDRGHRVVVQNVAVVDELSKSERQESGPCADHEASAPGPDRDDTARVFLQAGDYAEVHIVGTTLASLKGLPLVRTNLTKFHNARELQCVA